MRPGARGLKAMKEDEKNLLLTLWETGLTPRVANREILHMNHKRMWYILHKWTKKGWYDWGVSVELGWLEDEGKKVAQELHDDMEIESRAN